MQRSFLREFLDTELQRVQALDGAPDPDKPTITKDMPVPTRNTSVRTLAAIGALTAVAACGSGSSKGGATTTSSKSAIKVMTITSIKGSGANFPDVATAAKAAVNSLNATKINGRSILLEICDDQGQASETAKCARQAVADKVTAVVGSVSFNAAQYMPILEAAKIPYFAGTALSAQDFSSKDSYPVVAGPVGFAALGAQTVKDGCKDVGVAELGIPVAASGVTFFQLGRGSQGAAPAKVTIIPPTTTDYSASASALKGKDCVFVVLPDPYLAQFLAAAKQQSFTPKIYAPGGAITQADVKAAGSQLEGAVSISDFVSLEDPAWSDFKSAVGSSDPTSLITQNTWVGFQMFASIAKTLTSYDGAAFQTAVNTSAAVTTGGLAPNIDFTKEFAVPQLNRVFNTMVTYLVFKGGMPVALRPGYDNAAAYLAPKK
jgi:ABC-type branched-subunit amino acid transport system substrate-binding protein